MNSGKGNPFSKLEKFSFSDVTKELEKATDPEERREILLHAFSGAIIRRNGILAVEIANHCRLHDRLYGKEFETGIGLDYGVDSDTAIPEKDNSDVDPIRSSFWGKFTTAQKIGWGAAILASIATAVGAVAGFFKPG